MNAIVGGVVAFIVVAGWAVVRWFLRGRDPSYLDDPSILMAAPPDGMTAATATIIDGGRVPVAFMAALLDLASRDEIAFQMGSPSDVAGGGGTTPTAGAVGIIGRHGQAAGIEIHGHPTDDPRIRLNRRRPVGEGEAWLLAALKAYAIEGRTDLSTEERGLAAMTALGGLFGFAAGALGEGPDGTPHGAFVDGMSTAGGADPQAALIAALTRAGKPVPESMRAAAAGRQGMFELMSEAMRDPAAIAADPAPFAARVEAVTGKKLSPQDIDELASFAREHAARSTPGAQPAHGAQLGQGIQPSPGADAAADMYVSPQRAIEFHPPLGFGTLLESYARRRGWIVGMSFLARWRWRGLAALEVAIGLVLAGADNAALGPVYGAGLGIAGGGIATWIIAPLMASRTQQGAVMKAQLAAYRRTLEATFATSPTLDVAVTSSGLTWLETPDQALVWGIALGLRTDVEDLLGRTSAGMASGTLPRTAFLPTWVRRLGIGSDSSATGPGDADSRDYASVFAAIERIGSAPSVHS